MLQQRLQPPPNPVFSVDIPVRVTDLNYGKHLGHMELVGLLHEARVLFLQEAGMTELDVGGCSLMVVDLAVSYRSEAFLGDVLKVDVGLRLEGSRGVELSYGVRNLRTGKLVAVATTGVIFFDAETGRVAQVPEAFGALVRGGS